jgi:hypothetical protein
MKKTMKAMLAAFLLAPGLCLAAEKIAPKTLEFLEATTISGYVQSSYQHSWQANGDQNAAAGAANASSSPGVTPGRLFNPTRNSFNIDQVKLTLEKPLDEADFAAGYRVDLLFGETASLIHSTKANGSTFNLGNDGDLEQAYVQFRIPVGTGLDVKFGKFVTLLGNEVIDAPANWNYSRSYLFGYAVPFTHTGALLSYAFMKADEKNPVGLDMQLAVVNGWDNIEDNNSGKSLMGRVGVTLLGGKLVFATMAIGGPEQTSNNEDMRWVVNEVITWNATDKLSFALEGLYGEEDFSRAPLANGDEFAKWWGGAFYAKYQWTPHFSTAGRVEYFKDNEGVRLAGTGLTPSAGVNVASGTLSMQLDQVWKNLTPRLEFRYDKANEPIFGTKTDHSIFTVSMDMIYVF